MILKLLFMNTIMSIFLSLFEEYEYELFLNP